MTQLDLPRPSRWRRLLAAAALAAAPASTSIAQDSPVYVDDSPQAWELFQQAREQARDNAGEAVRLYQELLDDYPFKLLPVGDAPSDHFAAVRGRVLSELIADARLLDRYRAIETGEALRLLQAGALERLSLTRPLTSPGLEALLRLAERDIESARFDAALGWLDEALRHPDLAGRSAAHGWYMVGLAAHYLGDVQRASDALAGLEAAGEAGRELRARRQGVVRLGAPTQPQVGVTVLDRAAVADLDELVGQPIWSMMLDESLAGGAALDAQEMTGRQLESRRRSGALLTAAPTATDEAVYINDGRRVHALDRFTGRPFWPPFDDRAPAASSDRLSQSMADLSIVSVGEESLVTLTGHAFASAAGDERRVVCLDPESGRLRWSVQVDQLSASPDFEGLVPHGTPIIAEGLVHVLARKLSRQLLTSCYVVTLDLADGRLRWARHLASSAGIRTRQPRPYASLVYEGGELIASSAIGAISRLHAATGQTVWLRRVSPPLNPFMPEDRRPWEIDQPVVTPRGVVFIRPDQQSVALLDWPSGEELEVAAASGRDTWNAPRYLLAHGDWVLGVSDEVRAFHVDDLSHSIWTFPARAGGRDADSARPELLGRVQLVEGALVVPTTRGVHLLDEETGETLHSLELPEMGNPLATGPQLLVASAERLEAFMPFHRAEQMLRRQIAQAPANPGPALALMRLGMQVRDLALALEVADLVIRAVNVAPTDPALRQARQELLDILLQLDRDRLAATPEQGEQLHGVIGVVAQEPPQRVLALLARGDWYSEHDRSRALEAYQSILSDRLLAGTPHVHDGSVRAGADWAGERISTVLRKEGTGVYQPQADFAARRLAMLRSAVPPATADEYLALAREFPFAESAVEAARLAAASFAAAGQPRRAVAALTALYRAAPRRDRAEKLLSWLAAYSVRAGWPEQARLVLAESLREHGDQVLEGPDGSARTTQLIESIAAPPPPRPPLIGLALDGFVPLPGVLLAPQPESGAMMPPDRALIRDGQRVQLYMAPGLERGSRWSADLDLTGTMSLLWADDRDVLLWVVPPAEEARAVLLDAATGRLLWVSPPEFPHDAEPGRIDFAPDGERVGPEQLIPLVGPRLQHIVSRHGGAVCWSLDGPEPVLRWERRDLLQVSEALRTDSALVLAGQRRPAERPDPVPTILVLDPRTGETEVTLRPLGGGDVTWMVTDPMNSLIYGTAVGIDKVDLFCGEPIWSSVAAAAKRTQRGWLAGEDVVVEGPSARPAGGPSPLRTLRLADGEFSGPFDQPAGGEWDRDELRGILADGDGIFTHYTQHIVRYHPTGAVLGADRNSEEHDYRWLFATDDRLLVVSRFRRDDVGVPGEAGRRTHVYRLYQLSSNCKLLSESFELPPLTVHVHRAAVIDGWLLVSTPSDTMVVPMPARPEN